jgi:Kef-type K+ transport system membrane component KefB/nucleotide-binding universal stress UspA family protein
MVEEGYITLEGGEPQMPGRVDVTGQGQIDEAKQAAQQVEFNLTQKGIDFLGYRTLKQLLSAVGRSSSFGSHDTPHLATGVEAEAASKPYEFGDTMNLDIPPRSRTPSSARGNQRVPLDLDYGDLMVHQAEYRSSCATVLMLDISHSMILYGEDRFTPAKKVALALSHLIRTQFPGDTLRVVTFGDRARRSRSAAAARRRWARSTPTRPRARGRAPAPARAEEGHAADHHDHRRQAERDHPARRPRLQELGRARPAILRRDVPGGGRVPEGGHPDQHLHARARPLPGAVRPEGVGDRAREGLLHDHADARPVHHDGLLILLLLLTGLETNLRAVRGLGRASIWASALGMLVPFASGFALGWLLPDAYLTDPASRPVFAAFLATAMAISALPVIAKILIDLGLIRRNVGLVTLSAAVVDDTTGWLLLSAIAGIASGGGFSARSFGLTLVGLALFVLAMRWVAYPLFARAVRAVNEGVGIRGADLTLVLCLTFFCAAVTEAMGVHALLGAFAAGLVVRQTPRMKASSLETLETFVLSALAPVFFAFVGLRVDLWALSGWGMPLTVLGVAIAGKVVGCYVGGRLGGLSHWESLALGFGMNARGAMGLVVALIGLSLGLLTEALYATIVLVAVVTSFMAPLLLRWAARHLPLHDDERRRLEDDRRGTLLPSTSLRVLVPTAGGANALAAIRLAAPLVDRPHGQLTALYVSTQGGAARAGLWRRRPSLAGRGLEEHFRRAAALVGGGRLSTKETSATDVAEAVLREASRDYDLVFLGSAPDHAFDDPLALRLINEAPVPVVLVQSRSRPGERGFERILLPVDGGVYSRYAAELALAHAAGVGASVEVLHVVTDTGLVRGAEAELEAHLRSLGAVDRGRVTVRVACHSRPAELIVAESQSGRYDLLVIGAEPRLLGRPSLFGQGTAQIVDRAGCSTAVVLPGPL